MWVWKRTQEILIKVQPVVNILKGAVLRLCGVEVRRPLQISESKIVETSAEPIRETTMTFRTGTLVRTVGSWEGWITLGVAYSYDDWLEASKEHDTEYNRRYVYVKAIAGRLANEHPEELEELGGYYPQNLEIISTTE